VRGEKGKVTRAARARGVAIPHFFAFCGYSSLGLNLCVRFFLVPLRLIAFLTPDQISSYFDLDSWVLLTIRFNPD